jgi:hypothetical protein
VIGFQQFVGQPAADVLADESTTSATFGDLVTVGPSLSGLADGKYLLALGAAGYYSAGVAFGFVSPSFNGDAAVTTDGCYLNAVTQPVSGSRVLAKTFRAGGNNSVVLKYSTGTAGTLTTLPTVGCSPCATGTRRRRDQGSSVVNL